MVTPFIGRFYKNEEYVYVPSLEILEGSKLNLTEDSHNISPFKSNDSKATVALSPSAIAAVCGCT